ncbi:MAG: UDP-N-acetylglucosamine 2-epimerase (non-hydrolyzing), partial [Rhodospirillaceae bacterium]|nr:UDP-N-acetylglucosamine 2-epimerase (non-hydrolyzing) [Rhodospirillaceae bacterium]
MKLLSVVGARPQFVKAAVLSRALAAGGGLREVMVHTGQHFDDEMSAVFFRELSIPAPAYELGVHGGGHGAMTGRMLAALEPVIEAEAPDLVLVYGDTNSTLAGALAAAKLHVPVAHVEAGLRSFNRRMPEEVNRVLTDHASDLLFCPTAAAVENLRREGIVGGVHWVGDVMYDAALFAGARARAESDIVTRLGLDDGGYALATVHRAENTDDEARLRRVVACLRAQVRERPVVLPLHPRTRQAAERFGIDLDGLLVCPPLGYLDMARLLQGAALVLTDSGGLQKEAYFHRVPCVTLRDETEWVETVECGWNRLWTEPAYKPRRPIDDYGDGRAGEAVVAALRRFLADAGAAARRT